MDKQINIYDDVNSVIHAVSKKIIDTCESKSYDENELSKIVKALADLITARAQLEKSFC